jgi:hypothetical protein
MLALLFLLVGASAHSWVACTDYRVANPTQSPQGPAETDPARRVYDESRCFGYPRDWQEWHGEIFGLDRGYNYQPSGGPACKTPRGDAGDYTEEYPAARYAPGQVACIAHPTKNHVAAPCTNAYIPDHGQSFFVSAPGLTTDPPLEAFGRELTGYDGTHVTPSFDYKGYGNAPTFCDNPDKALATACFDVPADLAPGRYTFLWRWAFNSPDDVYTSCWEADVGGAVAPAPTQPTTPAPIQPKTSAPTTQAPPDDRWIDEVTIVLQRRGNRTRAILR